MNSDARTSEQVLRAAFVLVVVVAIYALTLPFHPDAKSPEPVPEVECYTTGVSENITFEVCDYTDEWGDSERVQIENRTTTSGEMSLTNLSTDGAK